MTEQELLDNGWRATGETVPDGKSEMGAKVYEKVSDGVRAYKTVAEDGTVSDYNA